MLLIVSFSLGLAAVLIGIGIAMVHGVRLLSRSDWLARFGTYAPVVSAVVVSALGIGLTLNAWNSFKFSASVNASAAPPDAPSATIARSPTAPTSSRLLYIGSDSTGHDQLFMLPLTSGSLEPAGAAVQYTRESSSLTGYSLSPDRRTILYSVFHSDGGSALWAINADGSGRRLALDCPQAECNSPAWYPDGTKVAYERLENTANSTAVPRFSIWWLDLSTGHTQPVFQDASFPSASPRFSPDGQWLSYLSAAGNTLVIYNLQDARTLSIPLGSQSSIPATLEPQWRCAALRQSRRPGRAAAPAYQGLYARHETSLPTWVAPTAKPTFRPPGPRTVAGSPSIAMSPVPTPPGAATRSGWSGPMARRRTSS